MFKLGLKFKSLWKGFYGRSRGLGVREQLVKYGITPVQGQIEMMWEVEYNKQGFTQNEEIKAIEYICVCV